MKVGRNDPCSCGSDKKYKKCCLEKQSNVAQPIPDEVKLQIEKMQAIQKQIKRQQGAGRSIISEVFMCRKFF